MLLAPLAPPRVAEVANAITPPVLIANSGDMNCNIAGYGDAILKAPNLDRTCMGM